MTLFRKYYKEANDSIKPDEEFVNRVISNAKKRQTPLYARYSRYAAIAAAAVIIVSGAAASLPLWQRANDADGVLTEEVTETQAPFPITATGIPQKERAAIPEGTNPESTSKKKSASSNLPSQNETNIPKSTFGDNASQTKEESVSVQSEETGAGTAVNTYEDETAGASDAGAELFKVAGESDFADRKESAPEDMAPYAAMSVVSVEMDDTVEISDSDLPAPQGYYCVNAAPNGYTFMNDEGAYIIVTINYGGEEREPYIEENGEKIYAVFTSFGLSVTINASGADRSVVEEIITSLK